MIQIDSEMGYSWKKERKQSKFNYSPGNNNTNNSSKNNKKALAYATLGFVIYPCTKIG
jgi:hypothetical protein